MQNFKKRIGVIRKIERGVEKFDCFRYIKFFR